MIKEYVTPPYSKAMIDVCNSLEKKIDAVIKFHTDNGKTKEEAQKATRNYITKDIKIPE